MIGKSEFEDILLARDELDELKRFKSQAPHPHCLFPALMDFGLVEEVSYVDGNSVLVSSYSITRKGSRYLEYRKRRPWKNLGRYLVSNWIGLLTLILTIITFLRGCSTP